MAAYGVTDDGNWEGRTILSRVWPDVHTPPPSRDGRRVRGGPGGRAGAAAGAAVRAAPAGPRRQGARRLERAGDRGASPMPGRLLARRRPRDRYRPRPCARPRRSRPGCWPTDGVAVALVEGRPGDRPGRAGGLRGPRRRPARAVRGHLRRALVHDGPGADGPGAGAVRRPGRRVLRHRRRPRATRRPTQGPRRTTPSRPGTPMAALVLLRLAAWTGEGRYRDAAERALRTVVAFVERYPTGFAQWLVGDGSRPRAGRGGGDRRRSRRPGDAGAARGRRDRASARTRSWRSATIRPRASSRSSPIGSPSTAGPPRTSVAASSAACPSPSPGPCCERAVRGGRRGRLRLRASRRRWSSRSSRHRDRGSVP